MKRIICLLLALTLCLSLTACKPEEKTAGYPENWETMQSLILKPMDEVKDALQISDDQLEEFEPLHFRILDQYVVYEDAKFELELNPAVMPSEEQRETNSQYDYSELPVSDDPEEMFLLTFVYQVDCDKLEEALPLMERVVSNYTELLGEPDSGNYLETDAEQYFKESEKTGMNGALPTGPYVLEVIWDCTPEDIHTLEYTTRIWIYQRYDEAGEDVIWYHISISYGCRMKPVVGSGN